MAVVLYLIEILHQTTTERKTSIASGSCILSKFYIKPQLYPMDECPAIRCILSKFYIKPQQRRVFRQYDCVVSYRNSTSNHNHPETGSAPRLVVSYRNSTSNHNFSPGDPTAIAVVSYRNSTSNHNQWENLR